MHTETGIGDADHAENVKVYLKSRGLLALKAEMAAASSNKVILTSAAKVGCGGVLLRLNVPMAFVSVLVLRFISGCAWRGRRRSFE